MTPTPPKIVLIIASVREGRIGPTVAHWFVERIDTPGPALEILDVAWTMQCGTA
ncbi:NAD(P)H-dependent oxidoreductase [Gordonia sp. C13]|uniref:NAD(P)H-dependent oxidoreductase n=1 Tax=Gordonia sp. C13 TaxID=2935078 RepID=UPI00200B0C63|nr:NAD(P)H-dependent oxidoreductase [Gordonia sp. C13]MCK8616669.1 NAD(P)H-dependent oxidoreductase [Gordonia sp. C13]